MTSAEKKVIFFLSLTSDIGIALAQRYAAEGHTIVGTYRTEKHLALLKDIPNCHVLYCDVADPASIRQCVAEYQKLQLPWHTFISCPCTPLPLGAFFTCDFDEWSDSIHVNAIEQLRFLHALYPLRAQAPLSDVVFFAGGGTNNAVLNFSAYTSSKIFLIKMCELIDAETPDLRTVIVGPGWTKTKTHYVTLEHVDKSDKKYAETVDFMERSEGTSMDDIYGCITWLCAQDRAVVGGRNFSVVHDHWKRGVNTALAAALGADANMYKLRRSGNNYGN